MPLSGNLKELSFPEVLRLLRDRTGNLRIMDKSSGDRFSFGLSSGKLVCASEGGRPIPDTLALHSAIQRLSGNGSASFEFEEIPMGELVGPLTIPIDRILLSALAAIRSPERYIASLPHPDTRFRSGAETTPWLTEDLLAFWVGAERLFRSGVSASEIVAVLGIPLPHVLLELFKLRLLGVIVPVRVEPSPSAPAPSGPALSLPELPPAPTPAAPEPPRAVPVPEPLPPPPPPFPSVRSPSPAAPVAAPRKPAASRSGILARIAAGLRGLLEKMYE